MKTSGGFLITRIHQLQGRVFARLLREAGVEAFNGPQGRILYVLWEHDGLTISDIGRLTSLAKTTLTSMLDRMEAQGLVRRVPDAQNRRQIHILLTERARDYQAQYDAVSQRMNELFYKGFAPQEITALETALDRILTTLEEADTNG